MYIPETIYYEHATKNWEESHKHMGRDFYGAALTAYFGRLLERGLPARTMEGGQDGRAPWSGLPK